MFNFQYSQIYQQKFEQLADLFLKFPMVHATSKFYVGNLHSTLYLPIKPIQKNNALVKFHYFKTTK